MNSAVHALLQPTTLTRLGGLATIIVATLALGPMAQDQSGQSAAMVSKSFRAELGASDDAFGLLSFASDSSRRTPGAVRPLPDVLDRPIALVKTNVDPEQDFTNLRSELERIVGGCNADSAMREIRMDFRVNEMALVDSFIKKVIDLLADAEPTNEPDAIMIEIQSWAASPTQSAWVAAAHAALRLRNEIEVKLPVTEPHQLQISSSAALWPHPDQARPAVTILMRLPLRSSTY